MGDTNRRGSRSQTAQMPLEVNNDNRDPLSGDSDLDDEGINCPDCTKMIEENDDALQCELCDYWYHIGCQNITKATYKFLEQNARSRHQSNRLHWYCRACDTGAVKILKAVTKISRRQDALEQKLADNTDKISRHDSQIDQIEKTLETHSKQIQDFQTLNINVPANQAAVPAVPAEPAVPADSEASRGIISEVTRNINERLERQKNIVVFNVDESNSNLKDDIVRQDMAYVQELCRYLAGEDLHYSVKRLGRRERKSREESEHSEQSEQGGQGQDGGVDVPLFKPRPLLVQLRDAEEKGKIMKKLFKLGDDDVPEDMANIAVKHDMTPAEREADRDLRKQAKEKTVQLNQKNIKFVVRGPPWEREIVKMELKGKRLIPVMDQGSGGRS